MIDKLRPSWNQRLAAKKVSGRPSLSLEEELFIYYRAYVTMEWLGIYFHLDKANVSRHINRIVDATEIAVQRPQNSKKQKETYSGKKKKNAIKFEIIYALKTHKIVNVSNPFPGSVHDFTTRKRSTPLPPLATALVWI